jgi:uncharacterized phage-associated protein
MVHKKLQKLCYYAVAWNYALRDEALVGDTAFEAWRHGPVSPTLYAKYKDFHWKEIEPGGRDVAFDTATTDLLESVWITYGEYSANSLEAETHSELPWQIARNGLPNDVAGTTEINPADMRRYYLSIYEGGDA